MGYFRFIIISLITSNMVGYTVSVQNLLDVQVRVTAEYLNPELCKPFTFDVPSNKTIEQAYAENCCFVKLTAEAKNKSYFQFGTGACENYNYIIRPKSSSNDFIIERESGSTFDKPS